MPLDVRPDHLSLIKNILQLHLPNREVIAFGSRAKSTAKRTSDLDLCVMGEELLSFEMLATIRDAFSLSSLPYKIDIVEWATLDPSFQKIIQEHYELVQD